jgi:putative hydrolase of the HAD superfamily
MIRNIVFDMGQVLIAFRPDLLIDRLGVPQNRREELRREVFQSVAWVRLDRGTITEEEAVAAVCKHLSEDLHQYAHDLIYSWWERPLVPTEGMDALLAELKERGYKIYLLSNASTQLYQYFDRIPGSQYFDGKIVSSDWKTIKPEREIYEILFREFALSPAECFFIDDLPTNVEAANRAGMAGTIFRGDMTRLRQELREAGVLVGAQ